MVVTVTSLLPSNVTPVLNPAMPRWSVWCSVYTSLLLISFVHSIGVSWDWGKWWTYTGISGPKFWGLINPEWRLCTHGRRQSPVDIQPHLLLHDPNLGPIHVEKQLVGGVLTNTGHSVVFILDSGGGLEGSNNTISASENSNEISPASMWGDDRRDKMEKYRDSSSSMTSGGLFDRMNLGRMKVEGEERHEDDLGGVMVDGRSVSQVGDRKGVAMKKSPVTVSISGGPLSYRYQVNHIQFHFGSEDRPGSEHTVNGTAFQAEMQIYAFNAQLYRNFSDSVTRPHGAVAVSVLLQVGAVSHPGLSLILDQLPNVRWAGEGAKVPPLSVHGLLPPTQHYITYEGSLTQPPCHETLSWIVYNKPVYVTKRQLDGLQQLQQGRRGHAQARVLSNIRPTQRLYHRTLRTNIDFTGGNNCSPRGRAAYYRANTHL